VSQEFAAPLPGRPAAAAPLARLWQGTLARGAAYAFIIYAASAGLGFLLQTLLARTLPMAEYGTFTYAATWAEILAYPAGLGLNSAALRFLPAYQAQGRTDAFRGFIRASLFATLLAGLAVGALVLAWGLRFSGSSPWHVWACAALLVPVHALVALYMQMSRARGRVVTALAPSMVLRHVGLAVGVLLLLRVGTPATAATVMPVLLGAMLAVLLVQAICFHRPLAREIGRGATTAHWPEWRRVSGPLLLVGLFTVLLGRLDLIAVGLFRGPAEVGLYNAALKTAALVGFVLLAINTGAAPRIAQLHATGDRDGLQKLVTLSTRAAFAASLVFCTLAWLFGSRVLSAFGPEYRASYAVLAVLVLGHLAAAGAGLVVNLLNMTGHQLTCLATFTGAVIAAATLNLLLVPRYGTLGAAWATVIATAAAQVVLTIQVRRLVGIRSSILSFGTPSTG
jgi:O-antigen/teichoic acid export membrane protein